MATQSFPTMAMTEPPLYSIIDYMHVSKEEQGCARWCLPWLRSTRQLCQCDASSRYVTGYVTPSHRVTRMSHTPVMRYLKGADGSVNNESHSHPHSSAIPSSSAGTGTVFLFLLNPALTAVQNKIAHIDAQRPISPALVDSFHRRHDYLRISLTERCNLRCVSVFVRPSAVFMCQVSTVCRVKA